MLGFTNTSVVAATVVALINLFQPLQVHAATQQLPDIETFLSRPNQTSARLTVQINKDPSALAPGYIFLSPYNPPLTAKFGTQIHSMDGELVFSGQYLQEKRGMNSHVCNVKGQKALCFTDAVPGGFGTGHSQGPNRFFNKHYKQIGPDYTTGKHFQPPDAHELNTAKTLKGKGFIRDIFQPERMNLKMYDGPKKGFILAGCFQQVSFDGNRGNNVEFEWCSHKHTNLYETYSYIAGNKAGNQSNSKNHGTKSHPWDYFHINSIDRDDNGDYYVSSRQFHAILKVAGPQSANPGHVIWRFGGRYSDFQLSAHEKFSQQHDVRVHSVDGDKTVLSIFDNHAPNGDGTNYAPATSAKWFQLDSSEGTAKLLQYYLQPESKKTPTGGQASNVQGGNAFMGWGQVPSVSEHRRGNPGEVIYYATFNDEYQSYKSYKATWVGEPALPPDVFAYQLRCGSSQLAVYMSWNGATEYKGFKVFAHSHKGASIKESKHIGTFERKGYETQKQIRMGKFYRYITVQATDSKGKVMSTSKPVQVFVPNRKLRKSCSDTRCPEGTSYGTHHSMANKC